MRSTWAKAPIGQAGVDSSVNQHETRHTLIEDFSDFKDEGGLMLPHTYKLQLLLDGQGGTNIQEWLFTLTTFVFNDPLDQSAFNMEVPPAT